MPGPITIDSEQREGLYELVRNHLGSIEDLWLALERTEDFQTAERLGRELMDDIRLLEDIGWRPVEERERFELTMAPQELARTLRRLRGEAVSVLMPSETEAQARREDADTERLYELGHAACARLLSDLDEAEEQPGDG